tara:strand:- start:266 stop:709 length:444 start_codon:yes stop_codon:yes gene_type:complete
VCKNNNKTLPNEKKGEIINGPDIETGEISNKKQILKNINEKNNKNIKTMEKKIINVQGNPNNQKSPKMIVREKIKALHILTKKGRPNLIKEKPKLSNLPIKKSKSVLVVEKPQPLIRKIKSELVKENPKVSTTEVKGNRLLLLTESP